MDFLKTVLSLVVAIRVQSIVKDLRLAKLARARESNVLGDF